MGDFEVLAEELEGEAEEGLVLVEGLVRYGKRRRGGQRAYKNEMRIGI